VVHDQTVWRWWRGGLLPVPVRQTAAGTIVVEVSAAGGAALMCARLYGRRGARDRALGAVMAAKAGADAAAV
jgi:predicted site-specific integrase-resolvase